MRTLRATLAFALAPWPSVAADLTWEELHTARPPHAAELAAAARLADAERRIATSAGFVREGVRFTVEAGPRRAPGEDTATDVALGLDLPLVAARAEQREAADALAAARPVLRAAARAEATLALERAVVALWRAENDAAWAREAVADLEGWLVESRRRAEAGADAAYEPVLVAGEVARARTELAEAAGASAAARTAFAALAGEAHATIDVAPLFASDDRAPTVAGTGDWRSGASALAAASVARLERALLALETELDASRWGVAGAVGREGEEEVARVGLAYRFPPKGESAAFAARREAEQRRIERERDLALSDLAGRAARAVALLAEPANQPAERELAEAERALRARFNEGRARVGEILPLRRALADARRSLLEARAARAETRFELRFLSTEVIP
jgi:cobalt-zinc-cadmium efflux system outer membrane protein